LRGVAAGAALLLAACGGADAPAPPDNLILDAQGVVFARADGTFDRHPFGTPRAAVEDAADAVYGDASARRSTNPECGAGPMAFTAYGAIQLSFRDERLAGWTMRRGAVAVSEDGIAPGMTRMQLDRQAGVRLVAGSTLPGEFAYRTAAGTIGGVLAGTGPGATVEALFAGTTCTSR